MIGMQMAVAAMALVLGGKPRHKTTPVLFEEVTTDEAKREVTGNRARLAEKAARRRARRNGDPY